MNTPTLLHPAEGRVLSAPFFKYEISVEVQKASNPKGKLHFLVYKAVKYNFFAYGKMKMTGA